MSRQNEATNLKIDFNWELKENSDHYPFFAKQVPIIMPFTGLHDDYHRPIDDANKINSAGMQDVLRLVFRVVYDLAERDTLPTYRAAARYEATRSHERDFEAPYTPATPRLGASWQAVEGEEGFKVTQITRNSAAHQAGLQVGDKVLQFWGRKPTTEIPLSALIWGAPQQTEVVVQRQGEAEPKTLPVNLPGNSMRIGLAWKDHEAEPGVVTLVLVVPGTPGELAGLQVKDRVLEVNGKRFAASEDLLSLLYKEPSPLNVLIERGGRLQIVKIHRPDDLKAKEAKAE